MTTAFVTIENKKDWDLCIAQFPEANFLQSWEWGEFHQRLGKTTERWCVKEGTTVIALYQIVLEHAKRGSYLAIAGGPLLAQATEETFRKIATHLRARGKTHKAFFARFRPQLVDNAEIRTWYRRLGIVAAPMHLTADLTLQLDLSKSDDQLLQEMRKNTRYEIRKAEKNGITTSIVADPAAIKDFYDIQCQVAQKHHFVPFSYEFFFHQFSVFQENGEVVLINAHKGDVLLAQAFVIFYNKEAVYHYGVSTEANAREPGSYACQWRAIQEAKRRDCVRYNFWGIAPEQEKEHRFAGVSLFKRGFGGTEVAYVPAHDLPISHAYWLTYLFERWRKWQRKL